MIDLGISSLDLNTEEGKDQLIAKAMTLLDYPDLADIMARMIEPYLTNRHTSEQ